MRINVYNEEMAYEWQSLTRTATNTGIEFHGMRMFLKSPDSLHHTEEDDDRSAITWFWHDARTGGRLADMLESMAMDIRSVIRQNESYPGQVAEAQRRAAHDA